MAKAIPGARYVEFPGTTHSVGPNLRSDGRHGAGVRDRPARTGSDEQAPAHDSLHGRGRFDRACSRTRRCGLAAVRSDAAKLLGAFEGREIDRAGDDWSPCSKAPRAQSAAPVRFRTTHASTELSCAAESTRERWRTTAKPYAESPSISRQDSAPSPVKRIFSSRAPSATSLPEPAWSTRIAGSRRVERRPGSAPSLRGAKLTPLRDVGDQPDHQRTDEQVTARHGFGWELRFASWCGVRSEWPTAGLRPVTARRGGRRVRWSGGMRGSMVGWRGRCVLIIFTLPRRPLTRVGACVRGGHGEHASVNRSRSQCAERHLTSPAGHLACAYSSVRGNGCACACRPLALCCAGLSRAQPS